MIRVNLKCIHPWVSVSFVLRLLFSLFFVFNFFFIHCCFFHIEILISFVFRWLCCSRVVEPAFQGLLGLFSVRERKHVTATVVMPAVKNVGPSVLPVVCQHTVVIGLTFTPEIWKNKDFARNTDQRTDVSSVLRHISDMNF